MDIYFLCLVLKGGVLLLIWAKFKLLIYNRLNVSDKTNKINKMILNRIYNLLNYLFYFILSY